MKKLLFAVLFILSVGLFGFCTYQIFCYFADSQKTAETTEEIAAETAEEIIESNENTEIVPANEPKDSLYWRFLDTPLISVDFSNLKKSNPDTVGWLQLPNTNINYPFVQSTNNDYYIDHSFTHGRNSAGWIFLDFRNAADLSDRHNIIYGHNRFEGYMFGSLKTVLTPAWQLNPDNYLIKISTPSGNFLYQIFSTYHIKTTADYLQTDFASDAVFLTFAEKLQNRSEFDFGVTLSATDHILTLSTCYGSGSAERLAVHAKLIKIAKNTFTY